MAMQIKGPKTFDPARAQQLIQATAPPPQSGTTIKSQNREEQMRALGFDDSGPIDDDDSDSEEDEGTPYYNAVARAPSGAAPAHKVHELEEDVVRNQAAKSRLEKTVETLEKKLETELQHKQATLMALKAAEEQVAMLKTSSSQQLSMLKREKELLSMQSGFGGGLGGGKAGDPQLIQRNEELEAEVQKLKSQIKSGGGDDGSGSGAASDNGQSAELKAALTKAEEKANQYHAELEALKSGRKDAVKREAEMDLEAEEREKELANALKENEQLKANLQNASTDNTRFHELNKEVQELHAKLSATQSSAAAAAKTAENAKAEVEAARKETSEANEKVEIYKSMAEEAEIKAMNAVEATANEMSSLKADLENMQNKYKKECKERRRLHNTLAELKGQIRVFCRVRPLSSKELAKCGGEEAIHFPEEDMLVVSAGGGDKEYEFDRVYSPDQGQVNVFADTEPLVTSVLDGYNVCIFAYGQTGSGKTHTMEGPSSDPGVNSRALAELFKIVEDRRDVEEIIISASLLEIYNETIRDLMTKDKDKKLDVRQGSDGVHVPDLTITEVHDMDGVNEVIDTGKKNRTTFATNMNEHSSRSHSILSIYIVSRNKVTGVNAKGKLHLVDLAGSERVGKTDATGDRLKEAQAINKSLSALGDVISALTGKASHVPYRNSKLTYLLQDSLGGDSKTLMFVNINPAPENSQETICSLNFAQRVRNVELGQATRNVEGGAALKAGVSPSPKAAASRRKSIL